MGTTGLETAFAALYTELVLPGELELGLVVERMTAGGALYGLPIPRIAPGEPANLTVVDLDGELGGRAGRLREPLGELLLPRPHAARPGAADGRRRRGRVPGAATDRGGGRPMSSARLRPARGRRPVRRHRVRRRPLRGRRDRVHDLDVRLPGGDDRPELRRPADHVHLPDDRQLRGLRGGDGVRPDPRPRRDHARRRRPRGRARRRARLARLARGLRHPGDHRPRHARARPPHPRSRRDAGRRLPGDARRGRGTRADRRRAGDDRPRPRARGDPAASR